MASRATPFLLLVISLVFPTLLAAAVTNSSAAATVGMSSPSTATATFVLAGERTRRKDPLDGLKLYSGGWNISDEHYWTSVGFTAAPVFAAAAIWFVVFGVALFLAACCFCCCPSRRRAGADDYSCTAIAVSLVLLLAFTAAAAVGCGVLYEGQGNTAATVEYVARRSGEAAASLRGFARSMEAARDVGVGPVTMPADVKGRIDGVVGKVGAAADELAARTASNAAKIRTALETMLVFLGWILVTATFLLCGTFLLLHNVVGDTCAAMGEWVDHPQARTALDDILPCVDTSAAADALARSNDVTAHLVAVINGVISNVSNSDAPLTPLKPPPSAKQIYYNQSGPPVPLLCLLGCAAGEVDLAAAPQAWRQHVCRVHAVAFPGSNSSSAVEVCATVGRLTPAMYGQMAAAARVGDGLRRYRPELADMADCEFVRRAFREVGGEQCPELGRYSGEVYRGLLAVAGAVVAAVVLWVFHSRERRRRRDAVEVRAAASPYTLHHSHLEEGALLKSPRMMYR
uniref:Uncharacterized protein n=1 Tax=Leersia perrieri TaxID=77586 RepID=A0A0D9VD16_9ORYZ